MAQYWYKKDKRIKRISEDNKDRDVVKQVAELKANGYVQVLDRRNPSATVVEKPKPKIKSKAKKKSKKSKAKK